MRELEHFGQAPSREGERTMDVQFWKGAGEAGGFEVAEVWKWHPNNLVV